MPGRPFTRRFYIQCWQVVRCQDWWTCRKSPRCRHLVRSEAVRWWASPLHGENSNKKMYLILSYHLTSFCQVPIQLAWSRDSRAEETNCCWGNSTQHVPKWTVDIYINMIEQNIMSRWSSHKYFVAPKFECEGLWVLISSQPTRPLEEVYLSLSRNIKSTANQSSFGHF